MKKKLLATLLVLMMVVSILPLATSAEECTQHDFVSGPDEVGIPYHHTCTICGLQEDHIDENSDCICDICNEYLPHTDVNLDCVCDVCGEIDHHTSDDLLSDENGHYWFCEICGEVLGYNPHEDNGTKVYTYIWAEYDGYNGLVHFWAPVYEYKRKSDGICDYVGCGYGCNHAKTAVATGDEGSIEYCVSCGKILKTTSIAPEPTTGVVASGICGNNLTWVLDTDGTLTISGTGKMTSSPWATDYTEQIKTVVIEDGATSICESAFRECANLTSVTIPNGVTSIGFGAFADCTSLTSVTIPDSVTQIDEQAFDGCTSLTDVMIPNGVTKICYFTFDRCGSLTSITIPASVTFISDFAFAGTGLTSVTIPASVTCISTCAFGFCTDLTTIIFEGDAPEFTEGDYEGVFFRDTATAYYPAGNETWTEDVMQDYGGNITWQPYEIKTGSNAEIGTTINLVTDHTNLCIRKDSKIVFGAELIADGKQVEDVSGVTFQIEDASIIEVSASFVKGNCLYASFTGIQEGTTTILFNDSKSGATASIPITVYDNNFLSFTLSSVPTQQIEKYETNFYNVNGLYIDSYAYSVNDDQSATVSFDVYNSNYTYGAVEIYDVNGNLINAVLIDKMSSNMTSMKEVLWDDVVYLVRDIFDGDLLSYRQESGFSKKTDISVTIPKNGYIKICNDPENSTIVNLVNSADLLMSLSSFMGEVKGYDTNSTEFAEKLTQKLVTEKVFAEFVKDGSELPKKLWANVGKSISSSPEALSTFSETIVHNITNLELEDVILSTAIDFGIDVGEETFTYFAGPFGVALKSIFAIGTMEDILVQHTHITQSAGIGSIFIQNQGGGILGSQQITVESEIGFDPETALRVFSVSIDSELLNEIKSVNYELYEAISNNTSYTYDISLLKNGNETQPGSKVTVCIPIPQAWRAPMPGEIEESIYAGIFKIYRIEEDGSATEMQIDVKDGCFVFETEHFSLYTLVKYASESNQSTEDGRNTTGELVWIAATAGGVIVILGVIFIFYKHRKKK